MNDKYNKEHQLRIELENKIKDLLEQLNINSEAHNNLVKEKKVIAEENNKTIEMLKQEIASLKNDLSSSTSNASDSEMDLLKLELANCQKDVTDASDTILRLNSELSNLNNEYLSSQNDVYALSENLSSLQISSDASEIEFRKQIDNLKVKLEVIVMVLADLYSQLKDSAELKSQILNKDAEIENLSSQLEVLLILK